MPNSLWARIQPNLPSFSLIGHDVYTDAYADCGLQLGSRFDREIYGSGSISNARSNSNLTARKRGRAWPGPSASLHLSLIHESLHSLRVCVQNCVAKQLLSLSSHLRTFKSFLQLDNRKFKMADEVDSSLQFFYSIFTIFGGSLILWLVQKVLLLINTGASSAFAKQGEIQGAIQASDTAASVLQSCANVLRRLPCRHCAPCRMCSGSLHCPLGQIV